MSDDMWPWENQKLYEVATRRKDSSVHDQRYPTYLTYASSPEIAKDKVEKALVVESSWWNKENFVLYAYERKVVE